MLAGREAGRGIRGPVVNLQPIRPRPGYPVDQGAQVILDITNRGDLDTTVHWHRLRLDNRYDGTDITQPPYRRATQHHRPRPLRRTGQE